MANKPKKQLSPERKELISKLIDEFDPKSVKDIEDMFKDMFSPMLQEMLEGELDDHLGYEKYEHSGASGSNSRNGHSSKRDRRECGPNPRLFLRRKRVLSKYTKE